MLLYRVGNFFVSILIPALQNRQSGYHLKPELMQQLLSALFQRAVIEDDPAWKLACMGAISTMYERYPEQFKGRLPRRLPASTHIIHDRFVSFTHCLCLMLLLCVSSELLIIPYYVYLLQPQRAEPIWRDHIIRFMQTVLREPINAKRFLTFGGLAPLIFMINMIHTLEQPNEANITVSTDEQDSLPDLNRNMSLSQRSATARDSRQDDTQTNIDEEMYARDSDDEEQPQQRRAPQRQMEDDDSDEDEERVPAASNAQGKRAQPRALAAHADNPSLLSSSDDDDELLSPPAFPPAPGPPPPPPPPQPPQPARNGPTTRPAPTPATSSAPPASTAAAAALLASTKSPTNGAAAPRAVSPAAATAKATTQQQQSLTPQSATKSKPVAGPAHSPTSASAAVRSPSAAAAATTPAHAAAAAAGSGSASAPPLAGPTPPADGAEPKMVTQAGGVRMKSAAESKWDWSDERENLMSGLPPIFSVEEVAARSIRLLRIIAYGGPKLRRQLTTPELLQCLSTMLLSPANDTREDALRLYLDLLSTSPHVIPFLVTTGLFPFIVYSIRFGFSPLLAKMIDRTHMRQTPEYVKEGTSALAPYLPQALINILVADGAEALRLAMESDTENPEMIWNATLRLHMNDSIQRAITPFLNAIRSRPDAAFPATLIRTSIVYDSLQDELCVGGVYLHPLNAMGESDLQSVSLKEPGRFVNDIQKALNGKQYAGDDLGAVLLAATIVVSKYGGVDECRQWKAFAPLFALVDPDDKASISIVGKQPAELVLPLMSKATQLLNALLILEGANCQLAFEAKGLDHLAHAITNLSRAELNDEATLIAVHHSLASFAELIRRFPPALKHMEHDSPTVKAIVHFTDHDMADSYPQPTMGALASLAALARSDRLLDTVIKQGGLLQAVRLLLFYGQEGRDEEQQAIDEQEMEVNRQVRLSAASMLTAVKERGNKKVQAILTGLLTAEGVSLLSRPAELLPYLDQRLDGEVKGRLSSYIAEQLEAIQQMDGEEWREYSDGTFTFK